MPRRVEAARVVGAGLELVPRVDPGHGVRVQPPPRQARVGLLEPLRGDEGHLQQPLALRESQPCLLVRRLHRRRAAELGFFFAGARFVAAFVAAFVAGWASDDGVFAATFCCVFAVVFFAGDFRGARLAGAAAAVAAR